jgi:hypothetical protein
MRDLSHNPPLRRAFELAAKWAKEEGRPMAVLNLNPCSGLYVTRAWHPSMEGSYELIAKVLPLEVMLRSAESGEDFAEIAFVEALLKGGPWFGAAS